MATDINDIRGKSIMDKLIDYSGTNPYIQQLQTKAIKVKGFFPTTSQVSYVDKYFELEPVILNKVVTITNYLGEQLKVDFNLENVPIRIMIERFLADTGKAFHVEGKLHRNQKSVLFYIPKSQIDDDLFEVNYEVNVDYEEYQNIDERDRTAYEYQKEGIEFLLKKKGCILADDMGLGKTYQSIIAALESKAERILIVCPAALKINWKREIMSFCDEDSVSVINGTFWEPAKFTIINYDILKNFHTLKEKGREYEEWEIRRELVDFKPDLIICDEAHKIKNQKSIRGEVLGQIVKEATPERVWLLTGTPIANRPMDFYNLLKLVGCPLTDNWAFYAKRYCAAVHFKKRLKSGFMKEIWITDGASNIGELAIRSKNYMLRRNKEDNLDLPEKIITPIYMELEKRSAYDKAFDDYCEWAKGEGKRLGFSRHLVELTVLRKFVALESIKTTLELTYNAIEEGKKVIIFTNFTTVLEVIMKELKDIAVAFYGPMSQSQRQNSVDKFQEDDKVKVFVGNIQAAGAGLTLTAAEVVIMNDLSWVPSDHAQAEDRAYRIGQKNKVSVFYPIFIDTIDTLIFNVLQKKKIVSDAIIGEIDDIEDVGSDYKDFFKDIIGD